MKRFIYIIPLFILLSMWSCQERHPISFDDINGVYFYNLSGTMSLSDSVNVTFVYETTDEMTLPVRIQLLGRPADYDREIEVRVTSENAMEEIDYNLPEDAYIPAGKAYTDYNIVLKRTPSLRTEEKVIEIV